MSMIGKTGGLFLISVISLGLQSAPASAQVTAAVRELPPLPDPRGVAGAFAGISGDALLLGGGANFPDQPPWAGGHKQWLGEIYVLPRGATHWLTGFKLPRPLAYGVALAHDGGVLCLGGSDSTQHHAGVFLLRWRDGRMLVETNFPALPHPLANACGTLAGNYAYVIGGEAAPNATRALTEAWRLDLAANPAAWQRLPDCPGPGRSLALAASDGTHVYALGGVELSAGAEGKPARRYLTDIWALSIRELAWTRDGDLPRPLAAVPGPAPQVGGGWFALLGGDDGSRYGFQPVAQHPGFPSRITLWHPGENRFLSGASLAAPRVTTPAVVWGAAIVIPSGEARPGVRSPVITAYRVEAP